MNPDKENKSSDRITKIAAVSFWILLWQSASMAVGEEILLASPAKVLGTIVELSGQMNFWSSISGSLIRMTAGFVMACSLGMILAVISYKSSIIRIMLEPFMQAVKSIPVPPL